MSNTKKLYIKTYGCQMNVYDSKRMAELLQPMGYSETDTLKEADMVILNTCHIREKAAEKVYSELGRIRNLKEARAQLGKKMLIAVAGCVGQAEGEEVFKRAPYVDIVVGPQSYHNLPDLIGQVERVGNAMDLEFTPNPKFDTLPDDTQSEGVSSFLTIQEGCDKFCTFCVVPYTRGAEFSRPVSDVYREAIQLVSKGAKELTLLGQNVNAYHGQTSEGDSWDLAKLIKHVATINGLERIRYTTSHPRDMNDALIEAHGTIDSLMPFLHLPVQSGSDTILHAMNRKHKADEYLKIIEKLRAARPDIAFSSDFIVGFPGETDQDFEDTMQLVKEVKYAQCYSFKYSPRPGTPGSLREDQIPEEVKSERLQRLQTLLNEQQETFNKQCIGLEIPVLFDHKGKYKDQIVGRSPYMQAVHMVTQNPENYINQIVNVNITEAFANSLSGNCENFSVQSAAN